MGRIAVATRVSTRTAIRRSTAARPPGRRRPRCGADCAWRDGRTPQVGDDEVVDDEVVVRGCAITMRRQGMQMAQVLVDQTEQPPTVELVRPPRHRRHRPVWTACPVTGRAPQYDRTRAIAQGREMLGIKTQPPTSRTPLVFNRCVFKDRPRRRSAPPYASGADGDCELPGGRGSDGSKARAAELMQ